MMELRNILFENTEANQHIKTANKSIMDFAIDHVSHQKLEKKVLAASNQVRICK